MKYSRTEEQNNEIVIFKNNWKNNFSSYSPESLDLVLGKILENLVGEYIFSHIKQRDLLT